jgi:hypothetical protein
MKWIWIKFSMKVHAEMGMNFSLLCIGPLQLLNQKAYDI